VKDDSRENLDDFKFLLNSWSGLIRWFTICNDILKRRYASAPTLCFPGFVFALSCHLLAPT
jgi:hypothetical protein